MSEPTTALESAQPSEPPIAPVRKSKRWFWITGGIVLLLAIGVVSLVVIQRSRFTPKIKLKLQPTERTVFSITFSPDGKAVAVGGQNTVQLWSAHTGELLQTITYRSRYAGYEPAIWSVAFTPDSRTLAVELGYWVLLFDLQTGEQKLEIRDGGENNLDWVAFSPDGKTLATGSPLRLWDAQTGQLKQELTTYFTGVEAGAFSPEGGRLAATVREKDEPEYYIKVWDLRTLDLKLKLPVGTHPHKPLVYSPDGNTLVSTDFSGGTTIWDAHTGELKQTLNVSAESLAFSHDGEMLAIGNGQVQIYDTKTWVILHKLSERSPIAFSPDSKVLALRGSRSVDLWDVSGLK